MDVSWVTCACLVGGLTLHERVSFNAVLPWWPITLLGCCNSRRALRSNFVLGELYQDFCPISPCRRQVYDDDSRLALHNRWTAQYACIYQVLSSDEHRPHLSHLEHTPRSHF